MSRELCGFCLLLLVLFDTLFDKERWPALAAQRTARVFEKDGKYTWACTVCLEVRPGRRFHAAQMAAMDGALHNGRMHGDGRIALVRGRLDPIAIRGAKCPKCDQLFGVVKTDRAETGVFFRGLVINLPVTVTVQELADGLTIRCPADQVELDDLVTAVPD